MMSFNMPRLRKRVDFFMVCPYLIRSEEQNRKDEKGEWINHKEKRIKSHLLNTLS